MDGNLKFHSGDVWRIPRSRAWRRICGSPPGFECLMRAGRRCGCLCTTPRRDLTVDTPGGATSKDSSTLTPLKILLR